VRKIEEATDVPLECITPWRNDRPLKPHRESDSAQHSKDRTRCQSLLQRDSPARFLNTLRASRKKSFAFGSLGSAFLSQKTRILAIVT